MSKTETSGVQTVNDALTVTFPADAVLGTGHSVVLHTPVAGSTSAPVAAPVIGWGIASSEMPDVSATRGVQMTSDEQV